MLFNSNTYCEFRPGSVPIQMYPLTHLNLMSVLQGRYYYPHVINEECKAQKSKLELEFLFQRVRSMEVITSVLPIRKKMLNKLKLNNSSEIQ